METDPFDEHLDRRAVKRMTSVVSTAPYVVDVLKLAWAGARSSFGEQARPEHALMLLPHLLAAAEAERREIRSAGAQTADEPGPSAVHGRARS